MKHCKAFGTRNTVSESYKPGRIAIHKTRWPLLANFESFRSTFYEVVGRIWPAGPNGHFLNILNREMKPILTFCQQENDEQRSR